MFQNCVQMIKPEYDLSLNQLSHSLTTTAGFFTAAVRLSTIAASSLAILCHFLIPSILPILSPLYGVRTSAPDHSKGQCVLKFYFHHNTLLTIAY